jgi:oligopeptide/dipeptide ABC transporter ATP-binding protein
VPGRDLSEEPVLTVKDLTVEYATEDGIVHAVSGVSFSLLPRETLGIVGESGSGKTATCLAILGLLPAPAGRVTRGQILFRGRDVRALKGKALRRLRGQEIAMIFQDSASALNPVMSIGQQIAEVIRIHRRALSRRQRRAEVVELLRLVGIPEAEKRYDSYPHELSGGMRQRVMIAIAIANHPAVLVADEPTTALDVTIQAQVLEVFERVRQGTDAATLLVTHDLGLISQTADRVLVMYAGRIVEAGDVFSIFGKPRHPYTAGLLESVPRLRGGGEWLTQIPGQPPSLLTVRPGCPFQPRCSLSRGRERCREEIPALRPVGDGHVAACHFASELESAS